MLPPELWSPTPQLFLPARAATSRLGPAATPTWQSTSTATSHPPGTGGLSLYPTAPCRVMDTRRIGSGQPFTGTLTPPVDVVNSVCGPPAARKPTSSTRPWCRSEPYGYLTLWPDGEGQPDVSTLNAADGCGHVEHGDCAQINGKIDAYAAGITQLILESPATSRRRVNKAFEPRDCPVDAMPPSLPRQRIRSENAG